MRYYIEVWGPSGQVLGNEAGQNVITTGRSPTYSFEWLRIVKSTKAQLTYRYPTERLEWRLVREDGKIIAKHVKA